MPDHNVGHSEKPISRLQVPDRGREPEAAQALIERHHADNWIRALSINPDTAKRFANYFEDLFRPTGGLLPIAERELIAVAVSTTNGCGLCEIHHTNALGEAFGDAEHARRIALDLHLADLSVRERTLADFAVKVTRHPTEVRAGDIEALRSVGLNDAEILEALETSAWFNHTNRIFIALGVQIDAKYFAAPKTVKP